MFEIKITGATYEELGRNIMKLTTLFSSDAENILATELGVAKPTGKGFEPYPAEEPVPEAKEEKPTPQPEPESPEEDITLDQLRSLAGEKVKNDKRAEVAAIVKAHGAAKLSEIKPEEFAAVKVDLEAL